MTKETKHPRAALLPLITVVREVLGDLDVKVFLGGSYVRGRPLCADLDFAVLVPDEPYTPLWERVRALADPDTPVRGCKSLQGTVIHHGVQLDFWTGTRSGWGPLCQYVAGSQRFNIALRRHAQEKGFRLGHRKITSVRLPTTRLPCPTQEALFKLLEFPWVAYTARDI